MKYDSIAAGHPVTASHRFSLHNAVVIYQTPDRRPLLKRITDRWRQCWQTVPAAPVDKPKPEPVWHGHWATLRHI